jgi:di/tricarboxylate transporter
VSFVLLIGLAILQKPDGKPFLNIAECHKAVPWPVLWLFGATFPLADAMKAPEIGIMATVTEALLPIVNNMSPFIFMAACTLLLGIVTQFTHNMVLGAMFLPLLCPLATQVGANATVMFFLVYIILNCSYVTPAASMQAGFIFGHQDIARKDAYLFGALLLVFTYIVLIAIGIPLGNMIF